MLVSFFQLSHTAAQNEWNEIKKDESLVQEKIDEYLKTFNESGATDFVDEDVESTRKTREKKKNCETNDRSTKRRKKRADSSDIENELINEDEDQSQEKIRTAAEILAKTTRAPAQERVSKEIHEINERIIQLVQVKNMGMATKEQEKQLKKLLVEQKKKTNDLKRLKAEQAAKKRAREIKKVNNFYHSIQS